MLEKYSEERIAKLQECGSIDIDLDLASILSIDDKVDYSSESEYTMICDLGVGYFLHDEK